MPCNDGGGINGWSGGSYEDTTKIDLLTQMLCRICTLVENNKQENKYFSSQLNEWWKLHKEIDKERIKKEKREKERQRKQDLEEYNKLKKKLGL